MYYREFTEFPVWKKAMLLLKEVYLYTGNFPTQERFGLQSDMRRAANSILHNLAEGYGRQTSKDKSRFYKVSRGSAYELISQLIVCMELNYIDLTSQEQLVEGYKDIIYQLNKLIKSLRS